jgi:hypothetical protein
LVESGRLMANCPFDAAVPWPLIIPPHETVMSPP